MHINMNQEKLICDLNTRLQFKDSELYSSDLKLHKASKEFDHLKRKYLRLKKKNNSVEDDVQLNLKRIEREN